MNGKMIIGLIGAAAIAGTGIAIGASIQKNVDHNKNIETVEENKNLNSELSELREKYELLEEAETQINTLNTEKNALLAEKVRLQAQITANETQIANLQAEKIALQNQIDSMASDEEIVNLQTQITNLNAQIEELQAEDVILNQRISSLEARVTVLENQVAELQNTVINLNNQLSETSEQIANLWNIFDTYSNYLDNEQDTLNEKPVLTETQKLIVDNHIANIENQITEKTTQKTQIESQKSEKVTEIGRLTSQKQSYSSEIQATYSSISNKNTTLSSYHASLANKQNSLAQNNNRINALQVKVENNTITQEELKELGILTSENKSLNEDISNLQSEIDDIQSEIDTLQEHFDNYSNRLDELEERIEILESEVVELDAQTVEIQSNIDKLNEQLDSFSNFSKKSKIASDETGEVIFNPYIDSEAELAEAFSKGGTYILNKNINLTSNLVVTKECELDLNGHTISNNQDIWDENNDVWSLISVQGGTLTINGNGLLLAKENDCYAVDIRDNGNLIINGGTFAGNITAVYVYNGNLVINDGYFYVQQSNFNAVVGQERYVLNCLDASYKDGSSTITVNGGTFENFNPANCVAEGEHTNFVSEGKIIETNSDELLTTYKVVSIENHEHRPGEIVVENKTENEDGSVEYDNVTYCSDCGEEISREHIVEQVEIEYVHYGDSIYNIPITSLHNAEDISNFIENHKEYGISDLTEYATDEMIAVFPGVVKYYGEVTDTNQVIILLYDTAENAKGFENSVQNFVLPDLDENENMNYLARYDKIGIFELKRTIPEHTHSYAQRQENYNYTETTVEYDLVTYCTECGEEISRERIVNQKISINLDYYAFSLGIGESYKLNATITPKDASIVWVSSDKNIATVNDDGLVTAISEGSVYITAMTPDGVSGASCNVNVFKPVVHGSTEYDPLTAAEAVDIANTQEIQVSSEDKYYISGTVTSFDSFYNNGYVSFYLDDTKFEIYHLPVESSDTIEIGDRITIYSKIIRYSGNRVEASNPTVISITKQKRIFTITSYDGSIFQYLFDKDMSLNRWVKSEYNYNGWTINSEGKMINESLNLILPYDIYWTIDNNYNFIANPLVAPEIEHGVDPSDPLNASEAYNLATQLESGKKSENQYYITGTVTNITNNKDGFITFYLDDTSFMVYRLHVDSDTNIEVGDSVFIQAYIQNYANRTFEAVNPTLVSITKAPQPEEIFKFYITVKKDGVDNVYEYSFKEGMTLETWANSEYNTDDWHVDVGENYFKLWSNYFGSTTITDLSQLTLNAESSFYIYY